MIRPIERDMFFLSQKSEPATKADAQVIQDLEDTLNANKEECVGMAANMIGVAKRIIIVDEGKDNLVMVNPVILSKSGRYETEEECLSLDGSRKTERWNTIEVEYEDRNFVRRHGKYEGWLAEVIEHEIDHCNGVLI